MRAAVMLGALLGTVSWSGCAAAREPVLDGPRWEDDDFGPPTPDEPDAPFDPCTRPDRDGDGHLAEDCGGDDCDERDAYAHPGAADVAPSAWESESVDERGSTGFSTSMALSPDGAVHVVYVGDWDLRYATDESGAWVTETVAPRAALDDIAGGALAWDDGPHIAFWDGAMGNLMYSTRAADGVWSMEDVALTDATYCAIAIAADGSAHIAYRGYGDARYVTNASGTWTGSVEVDAYFDSAVASSIGVDSRGDVHIAYVDGTRQRLMHALGVAGVWSVEIVDHERNAFPSMVIDGDDRVHIAFKDQESVRYASGEPGSWSVETVAPFGIAANGQVSLAVAPGGSAHIAFQGGDEGDLRYATNLTGSWEVEVVASGDPPEGAFPSVAIGDGRIHVFSYQATTGEMRHAQRALPGVPFDCR